MAPGNTGSLMNNPVSVGAPTTVKAALVVPPVWLLPVTVAVSVSVVRVNVPGSGAQWYSQADIKGTVCTRSQLTVGNS